MDSAFAENAYIIDLVYARNPADVIYDLSSCLDNEQARNRKIFLKLGDINLNQSQLMSVKSLIASVGSTLGFLETKSNDTKASARDLGIIITGEKSHMETKKEPEQTYKTAEELDLKTEENGITVDENKPAVVENKHLDDIFDIDKRLTSILEPEQESSSEPMNKILEETYTEEDYEIDTLSTMYVKQTLRSGQVLSFDGNILVIGDTHPGSEIIASGDITVWGTLGGIAHAGSKGNDKAKIRALKMNAIQLRISECYARRPDSLNTIFVEKTDSYTPEEAKIVNGEIVIFKMND